jgi:hypothetical protein
MLSAVVEGYGLEIWLLRRQVDERCLSTVVTSAVPKSHWDWLQSETKSIVRRLPGRTGSLIVKSPVQLDVRTCTRLLPFRGILGIPVSVNGSGGSLLQVRATIERKLPPNATISTILAVTSLIITT